MASAFSPPPPDTSPFEAVIPNGGYVSDPENPPFANIAPPAYSYSEDRAVYGTPLYPSCGQEDGTSPPDQGSGGGTPEPITGPIIYNDNDYPLVITLNTGARILLSPKEYRMVSQDDAPLTLPKGVYYLPPEAIMNQE